MLELAAALALAAAPKMTLSAPTHTPRVGARWAYAVRVTDARGKLLRARLTVQVVDPFGGTHPVELGNTKRKIVDHPFTGVFRDFTLWPPESRGFSLVFRVVVTAAGVTRRLDYSVRPR